MAGPVRVLCVDDNRDVADTTAELIRLFGHDAAVCYSGPAALAAARDFHPDVCLLDLNMPGMDGDEVARRLREQFPDSRIVLVALTAMSSDDARARTRRAGFDMHLVKPVDPDRLLSTVFVLANSNGRAATAASA